MTVALSVAASLSGNRYGFSVRSAVKPMPRRFGGDALLGEGVGQVPAVLAAAGLYGHKM
jgi:hypothetical protein